MSVSEILATTTFVLAVLTAVVAWITWRSTRSVKTGFADVATRFRLETPFSRGDTLELTFTTNGKRRSFRITIPEDLPDSTSSAVLADAAQKLNAYIVSQQPLPEPTMRLAEHEFPVKETTARAGQA